MSLVTRSNEPYDAIQSTLARHSQVLPKRVVERLADFRPSIETKRETICNYPQG